MKQVWNPPPNPEGWRPVRFADLAAIMKLLPPPPLTQDGLTHRFEGPTPHDTIYAIRAAFMGMLDAKPEGFVLVPIKPTETMLEELARIGDGPAISGEEVWGYMLAAVTAKAEG